MERSTIISWGSELISRLTCLVTVLTGKDLD